MKKVYYLIPDLYHRKSFSFKFLFKKLVKKEAFKYIRSCLIQTHKPTGGIKVIYQHCMLLRELGIDAKPLLMGKYNGNFFHYDIPSVTYGEVKDTIGSNDIIVATEFRPYEGLLFTKATKVLFLQNWAGLTKWLSPNDRDKNYLQLGYDDVVTCSKYCSDYVEKHMKISAKTIRNGIDLNVFKPDVSKRIHKRILAMSRKNPEDLKKILKSLESSDYDIRVVDGLTQSQLINEYQSADIFIATGYPEGFSLPPLEAMACGCVVVGFTGGAAREFMLHESTAMVAEDGDTMALTTMLHSLINNPIKKEKIRNKGLSKSQEYGLDKTKFDLGNFYKRLI